MKHPDFDPSGPGSVPWNAFDKALTAAMNGRLNSYGPSRNKSFPQARAKMRYEMRVRGIDEVTINEWTEQLNERVANQDFDGV